MNEKESGKYNKMRYTKKTSLEVLKEKGVEIKTVIDIGVNRETPELMAAFPDKKHLLFEPVTEYHNDIQRNYHDIPHELFPIALAEKSSEGYLNTIDVTGGGGVSHSSICLNPSNNSRQITIAALDDVLKSRNDSAPYLIKIDVDGVELQILNGATQTLKKCACVIIECPMSLDHRMFFDRANFLNNSGFILWDIVDFCYYKNELSQVDLVFVSSEMKQKYLAPWNQAQFDPSKWHIV
jgi:FkbM family methyltransferase